MEEGKRFSQIYLERGAPVRDSQRFRNRLSAYYSDHLLNKYYEDIGKIIHKETGAKIPWNQGYNISGFIEKSELRDVLDSITLIYQAVREKRYDVVDAENWKTFVARVFREGVICRTPSYLRRRSWPTLRKPKQEGLLLVFCARRRQRR